MIGPLFDQGGQFVNAAAAAGSSVDTYPSDGVGGGTATAGSSILADAKQVCILAVIFRTSANVAVVNIYRHDGTVMIQNLSVGTVATGSRTIDFGPIGLLINGGFYITQAANAPAVTVVYKKIA